MKSLIYHLDGVNGLPWIATFNSVKTSNIYFKSRVSWMTVMMQILSVSKQAFSLLSASIIAAVGMDIKVYRHSEALNGGFLQVQ